MKSFVEVALPDVLQLLARRIGLNAESVGLQLIRHAVDEHMDDLGLDDVTDYVQRLHGSQEFDELIERVVVPETWFFRDTEPFRCLQNFVREQGWPRRMGETLRVLSIPCSTGEEPYSIAITLLDLGLTADQFRVDGVDISRTSIQKARTGSYGANSFREKSQILSQPLDRFLRRNGDRSVVRDEVRAAARFTRANVAAGEFLPDVTPYHVIFSRNLLIYLVPEAREQVLAHFRRLLHSGGYLYLGHAESGVATTARWEAADERFPFAFQFASGDDPSARDMPLTPQTGSRSSEFFKLPFQPLVTGPRPPVPSNSDAPAARPSAVTTPAVVQRGDVPPQTTPPARPHPRRPATAPAVEVALKPTAATFDLLALARSAADAGQLGDAAHHCRQFLAEATTSAEAYCLLGTIRQAQGDAAGAEQCFHKALYLDPSHHEALVHMSLLAQRRGDASGAANFRRRAERLEKRSR